MRLHRLSVDGWRSLGLALTGALVLAGCGQTGKNTGLASSAPPAVTVFGVGVEDATPDRAFVHLTVSHSFETTPTIVAPKVVAPVVKALHAGGARSLAVNPVGQGPYSNILGGSTEITFATNNPREVSGLIEAAEAAVRPSGTYSVNSASVTFTLSNCAGAEQKAWKIALADAHARAETLAGESGKHIGALVAVKDQLEAESPGVIGCPSVVVPMTASLYGIVGAENSPDQVQVEVTLQVTYALAGNYS